MDLTAMLASPDAASAPAKRSAPFAAVDIIWTEHNATQIYANQTAKSAWLPPIVYCVTTAISSTPPTAMHAY